MIVHKKTFSYVKMIDNDHINGVLDDDRDEMNFFDGHDRFDESVFMSKASVQADSYAIHGFAKSYGRDWLLEQCDQHVKNHMASAGFTGSQLSATVLDVLRSTESGELHHFWFYLRLVKSYDLIDDVALSKLGDLLGFDNLGFLETLIQRRPDIIQSLLDNVNYVFLVVKKS